MRASSFAVLICVMPFYCAAAGAADADDAIPFTKAALPGVRGVTSINLADFNRDGLADIAVFEGGKHNEGVRFFGWCEAPDWTLHDFHSEKPGRFIGDSEVADINRDGWPDIVVPRDDHSTGAGDLFWYENPKQDATGVWTRHVIYQNEPDTYHQGDIEIADMDSDGRPDVVCRHLGRRRVRVCLQDGDDRWSVRTFDVRDREGMKLADLDRDGVIDIVMNGFWWAGPKDGWRTGAFTEHTIDPAFFSAPVKRMNNSTKNGVGDFNGDGRLDLALVSAEGNKVYLAVYLAPADPRSEPWTQQVVRDDFGNCHQIETADIDSDGDLDLIGGRSFGERKIFLWLNEGDGRAWREQIVDHEAGMYSGIIGDLGGDGDIDIVAPNSYAKRNTVWIIENISE